jgi:hypothetical protein
MRSAGGHVREALGGIGGDAGTGTDGKAARGRRGGSSSSKSGATGRLDRSGQEKVIAWDAVKENLGDLEALHGKMQQASIAFREKVKGVAEKSGLLASTVRAVVVARMKGDDFMEEKRRNAEQLSLALNEVGED